MVFYQPILLFALVVDFAIQHVTAMLVSLVRIANYLRVIHSLLMILMVIYQLKIVCNGFGSCIGYNQCVCSSNRAGSNCEKTCTNNNLVSITRIELLSNGYSIQFTFSVPLDPTILSNLILNGASSFINNGMSLFGTGSLVTVSSPNVFILYLYLDCNYFIISAIFCENRIDYKF